MRAAAATLALALAAAAQATDVALPAQATDVADTSQATDVAGASQAADVPAIEAAIAKGNVPLVEPQPDGSARVTFVWRGADTRTVELDWPVWTPDRRTNRLERIPGTDLWAKTVSLPMQARLSYRLVPDVGVAAHEDRAAYRAAFMAKSRPDPLNPRLWEAGGGAHPMSILELPQAPAQPWVERRAGVPAGELRTERLRSDILGNERDIGIYRPAGGQAPQWLLILFDGERYQREIALPVILDNLIAAGAIPPAIAVFVSNPSAETRARELACNGDFSRFLATELMPWIIAREPVPTDAGRRLLAGASYGGLTSACAALDNPGQFGAVLSQSGSFWWEPEKPGAAPSADNDGTNWMARRIAAAPRLPLRFHIEAGQLETEGNGNGIRDTGREVHAALLQKGYDASHAEPPGGHDWYSWRSSIADGLIRLMGKPVPAPD